MFRYLPVVLAFGLIVGLGTVQGLWSDRWSDPIFDIQEFADRLNKVPIKIGDWEGTDQVVDSQSIRGSGAVGHVSRTYKNTKTNQVVSLWFICGHPRDISMHTPDVCYPGSGFIQQGQKIRYSIATDETPEEVGEFFTAVFRKQDIRTNRLERVFWSWSRPDRSGWSAPNSPRVSFGGNLALYKMYLIASLSDSTETVDQSVSIEFAKLFLPEVRKVLFPETGETDGTADPAASIDGSAS